MKWETPDKPCSPPGLTPTILSQVHWFGALGNGLFLKLWGHKCWELSEYKLSSVKGLLIIWSHFGGFQGEVGSNISFEPWRHKGKIVGLYFFVSRGKGLRRNQHAGVLQEEHRSQGRLHSGNVRYMHKLRTQEAKLLWNSASKQRDRDTSLCHSYVCYSLPFSSDFRLYNY